MSDAHGVGSDPGQRVAERALASLRTQGPAQPAADLAARVARHALSSAPPSTLWDTFAALQALARPAAALGCAVALALGVLLLRDARSNNSATSLELVSAEDVSSAVWPIGSGDAS